MQLLKNLMPVFSKTGFIIYYVSYSLKVVLYKVKNSLTLLYSLCIYYNKIV